MTAEPRPDRAIYMTWLSVKGPFDELLSNLENAARDVKDTADTDTWVMVQGESSAARK